MPLRKGLSFRGSRNPSELSRCVKPRCLVIQALVVDENLNEACRPSPRAPRLVTPPCACPVAVREVVDPRTVVVQGPPEIGQRLRPEWNFAAFAQVKSLTSVRIKPHCCVGVGNPGERYFPESFERPAMDLGRIGVRSKRGFDPRACLAAWEGDAKAQSSLSAYRLDDGVVTCAHPSRRDSGLLAQAHHTEGDEHRGCVVPTPGKHRAPPGACNLGHPASVVSNDYEACDPCVTHPARAQEALRGGARRISRSQPCQDFSIEHRVDLNAIRDGRIRHVDIAF